MRRSLRAWVLAVSAVLCAAGLATAGAQRYILSTAGNFPGASETVPVAISMAQIAGYYFTSGVQLGYIQTGRRFIAPAPKGARVTYLAGINGHGTAVGGWCPTGQCIPLHAVHGYTYNSLTGSILTLDFPGTSLSTVAYGINDFGDIVGGYCPGTTGCPQGVVLTPTHGFLFSHNTYTTLDYPDPLVTGTSCNAINNAGTIAGWYNTDSTENGFIYQGGVYSLIDFPVAMATFPSAINNSGVVAGVFENADLSTHGFTYEKGIFTQVDVPPQRAQDTGVTGINDAGVLVGVYVPFQGFNKNFRAIPRHNAP